MKKTLLFLKTLKRRLSAWFNYIPGFISVQIDHYTVMAFTQIYKTYSIECELYKAEHFKEQITTIDYLIDCYANEVGAYEVMTFSLEEVKYVFYMISLIKRPKSPPHFQNWQITLSELFLNAIIEHLEYGSDRADHFAN